MQITVIRKDYNNESTIGEMHINGIYFCCTLEDMVRDKKAKKVYGKTAIPAGMYGVTVTPSKRFKMPLPLLLNVQGFEAIRIHGGNSAFHTEGCILIGFHRAVNQIFDCKIAVAKLTALIAEAIAKRESVKITIVDSILRDFYIRQNSQFIKGDFNSSSKVNAIA